MTVAPPRWGPEVRLLAVRVQAELSLTADGGACASLPACATRGGLALSYRPCTDFCSVLLHPCCPTAGAGVALGLSIMAALKVLSRPVCRWMTLTRRQPPACFSLCYHLNYDATIYHGQSPTITACHHLPPRLPPATTVCSFRPPPLIPRSLAAALQERHSTRVAERHRRWYMAAGARLHNSFIVPLLVSCAVPTAALQELEPHCDGAPAWQVNSSRALDFRVEAGASEVGPA